MKQLRVPSPFSDGIFLGISGRISHDRWKITPVHVNSISNLFEWFKPRSAEVVLLLPHTFAMDNEAQILVHPAQQQGQAFRGELLEYVRNSTVSARDGSNPWSTRLGTAVGTKYDMKPDLMGVWRFDGNVEFGCHLIGVLWETR